MKFRSREDRIVDIVAIVITALAAMVCLYPILYCFSMSLSDNDAIVKGTVWLRPEGFNLESYKLVMSASMFWRSLLNSLVYTAVGTLFSLFGNLTLGYVLSRRNFVFKNALNTYILIPMMFSGGLIPTFMVVRELGLYGNPLAVILPGAVSVWNCILAKTFFKTTIPDELTEAAIIDGADHFQILWRIVLPLSTTIIAILALYAAVGIWNDYFNALIYLPDENMQPLQLYLKDILSAQSNMSNLSGVLSSKDYVANYVNGQRIKYVLIVVSIVPILIVYPFVQKYFVKGVMLGSVKG